MPQVLDRPHFVIIGAMKCATSTLHDQLATQPGVFMSDPKEPNFFSDDDVWARGFGWYRGLFGSACESDVCGESSTHYTKLPNHPHTSERMRRHLPHARLVYVMRDPIDRMVSHYIHAWSRREVDLGIDQAVRERPEFVAYSSYAMQLEPWLDRFGRERVLPVFFERLTRDPQREFERICRFLGCQGPVRWEPEVGAKNVSAERLRYGPYLERVLSAPFVRSLRRSLLPETVRNRIKSRWRMKERPRLSEAAKAYCVGRLDQDMERLGTMIGLTLSCERFREAVLEPADAPGWTGVTV